MGTDCGAAGPVEFEQQGPLRHRGDACVCVLSPRQDLTKRGVVLADRHSDHALTGCRNHLVRIQRKDRHAWDAEKSRPGKASNRQKRRRDLTSRKTPEARWHVAAEQGRAKIWPLIGPDNEYWPTRADEFWPTPGCL
jgi:hypothetical protein